MMKCVILRYIKHLHRARYIFYHVLVEFIMF